MRDTAAFTGLETVIEPAFYMGQPLPKNEKQNGLILNTWDHQNQQKNRKEASHGQEKSNLGSTARTIR